ncbi:hypothetical protein PO242_06160 [Bacteroides ovatus]|jgi:hypothetical protein|uniref:hypothetical protein n=1 Tax=Bacteroides TaxID=816 RepID=UPI000E4F124B|nr:MULTISPECIES: hypothetical protein [Bacteroides]MDC2645744.1 hypothetical protein [Bacteroides ovatus]RHI42782.1 hypothetical protein DW165_24265 [Bacteroides ovatus]
MATDYSRLMDIINSEKERSKRMMSSLRVEDKTAILQLVCQLILSADGSMVEERDNCVVDYVLKELGYDTDNDSGAIAGNILWNQATEANPFKAFQIVSELNRDVKNEVRVILLQICKMGGNFMNRVNIAQQIFQRTNIEYYPL